MVLMSKTILNFDPSDYFSLTIHFFRYMRFTTMFMQTSFMPIAWQQLSASSHADMAKSKLSITMRSEGD